MISKGCLYHIIRVQDLYSKIPHIQLVPAVVREFPEFFPNDLLVIPSKWEIDFGINLLPETNPISIPPYRMAPAELKKLKGGNSIPRGHTISCLKSCKIISKVCLYYIVRVKDLDSEIPPVESVPVVNEFLEVFPNDLPSIPPERKLIFVSICYRKQIQFQSLHIGWIRPIERVEGSTQGFA